MKDLYHVLLMNLSEECLEVSTCFHKFARFGVDSIYLQNNPVDVEIGQVFKPDWKWFLSVSYLISYFTFF